MREILFRGKRVDDKKWIEGGIVVLDPDSEYIYISEPYYHASTMTVRQLIYDRTHLVDKKTVGQYAGLTDKNGKKIFEGDIIRYQFDNDDCPFPNKDTKKRIGRVFFQDWRASFALAEGRNGSDMCNQDLFHYVRNGNRTEVIGNIFDNPELLKEGDAP